MLQCASSAYLDLDKHELRKSIMTRIYYLCSVENQPCTLPYWKFVACGQCFALAKDELRPKSATHGAHASSLIT